MCNPGTVKTGMGIDWEASLRSVSLATPKLNPEPKQLPEMNWLGQLPGGFRHRPWHGCCDPEVRQVCHLPILMCHFWVGLGTAPQGTHVPRKGGKNVRDVRMSLPGDAGMPGLTPPRSGTVLGGENPNLT